MLEIFFVVSETVWLVELQCVMNVQLSSARTLFTARNQLDSTTSHETPRVVRCVQVISAQTQTLRRSAHFERRSHVPSFSTADMKSWTGSTNEAPQHVTARASGVYPAHVRTFDLGCDVAWLRRGVDFDCEVLCLCIWIWFPSSDGLDSFEVGYCMHFEKKTRTKLSWVKLFLFTPQNNNN